MRASKIASLADSFETEQELIDCSMLAEYNINQSSAIISYMEWMSGHVAAYMICFCKNLIKQGSFSDD